MIEQLEYLWTDLRDEAVSAFGGQTPRPEDEAAIVEIFERQPALVKRAIGETAAGFQQGQFRWGWSVLRSRIERAVVAPREAVGRDTGRERRVVKAEQWMRTVGLHFDRPAEIRTELFDHNGILNEHDDDDALVERMLDLWRELRTKGEKVEADAIARGHKTKAGPSPLPPLRAEPLTEPTPNPFL